MSGKLDRPRGDEVGAANVLGPASVAAATQLVREGRVFDLSYAISEDAPRLPKFMSPYTLCMWSHPIVSRLWWERNGATNGVGFADERVEMDLHTGTHVDALGHTCSGDTMYGGFSVEEVATNRGLARLGIEKMPPLITRGVLVDVPAALGRPLEAGEPIGVAELEHALDRQGLEIRRGDVVLFRTGWGRYYEVDNERYVGPAPGIGLEAGEWLGERGVVAIGSDTMVLEVVPDEDPLRPYAVHQLLLVQLGVYMIENVALEELAAAAVYEFLCLCLPPKFRGATASPVRIVAVS